ncbi:hypothetical protein V1290_005224 [Bradyrhizobium sp. AZCC 1578]
MLLKARRFTLAGFLHGPSTTDRSRYMRLPDQLAQ